MREQFVHGLPLPEPRTSKANVALFKCEKAWGVLKNFTDTSELPHFAVKLSSESIQQQSIHAQKNLSRPILEFQTCIKKAFESV